MIELPKNLVKQTQIRKSIVRYGDLPCKKPLNRDTAVLFMAGQKSPLERFWPMSQYIAQFYHTYNYEIPGMGVAKRHPDSPATIETMSEEIKAFIHTVIKEKNIIIVAGSVGFWFTTEAIQSDEILQKRVKKMVALSGMLGKDTFGFSPLRRACYLAGCRVAKTRGVVTITNKLLERAWFIDFYSKILIKRRHLSHLDPQTQKEYEEFEKFLLRTSDWSIHFSTAEQYMTTDPRYPIKLSIPLLALYSKKDQFFPFERQQREFSKVFSDITWVEIKTKNHAPLIVKDFREYKNMVPEKEILEFIRNLQS